MEPKVSVIIPNYNHASYLQQRVESILNQTYQDFELIILDDCSTDNSKEIIEQYRNHPKVSHIVYNTKNSGSTFKQWNEGIELAKGEYIWIAESDDFCHNNFLEKTYNAITISISLCFTSSYIVDSENNIKGLYDETFDLYKDDFCINGNEIIKSYLPYRNIIPNASAVLFRRKCFIEINKKNLLEYKINGDWYLWINMLKDNQCAFVSEPLNYFRRHIGASSPKNVLNFKNIEEAIRINNFLHKNGFLPKPDKLWLNVWMQQANYNLHKILTTNFLNIYKEALLLYRMPVLCYLCYKLLNRVKYKS